MPDGGQFWEQKNNHVNKQYLFFMKRYCKKINNGLVTTNYKRKEQEDLS